MKSPGFLALAALVLSAGLAQAQIVITTDTTIAPGDPAYQNRDIIVRGCTVTINGAQAFTSLTIERDESNEPGIVTHTTTFSDAGVNGMFLTIVGDLLTQGADGALVASRVDINAKGFLRGQGPGSSGTAPDEGSAAFPGGQGGSYGGAGGVGYPVGGQGHLTEAFVPGPCYGSFAEPADLGSGSAIVMAGPPFSPVPTGGKGAGAVHLAVGNNAVINGAISANGENEAAGGSGGSIWISASELSGAGSITAHGGSGSFGAGGGGGRIALHLGTNSFSGTLLACGGNASPGVPHCYGGPGSLFLRVTGQNDTLIFDNTLITRPTGAADLQGDVTIDADVIVRNKARLEARRGSALNLTINGALAVDATSCVGAFGRAPRTVNPGDGGPQDPFFYQVGPGGGGHGGAGGNATGGPTPQGWGAGGVVHGDPNAPTTFGGNGGHSSVTGPGWRGGGALRLTVSGPITLDGALTADGQPRTDMQGAEGVGAGGAGGSLWVTAPSISGAGVITSRGGNATGASGGSGGGGGGRIRIDTCLLAIPPANIQVNGGLPSGGGPGQPGTIVTNALVAPFASQSFSIDPFVPHETVVLTASAVGDSLSYQWRRNSVPIPEGFGGGRYTGTQTDTLTIADPSCADAATIDFVVSNICGESISNAAQLRSITDWNADGVVNSTDASDFINDWFTDQAKGGVTTDIN